MCSSTLLLWVFGLILIFTPTNTETINLFSSNYNNKVIKCKPDEDCTINCNGYDSCAFSSIQCPINNTCDIFCSEKSNSCFHLYINATYSSLFNLNGCSSEDPWTCSGITIYFPPKHINGNIRSYINTGDNLNGYSQSLQFYAINGWSDIDTSGYTGAYSYFYGIMHCTNDYTKTCNFSHTSMACQSSNNLCNNPSKHSSDSSSASSEINEQTNSFFANQTGILGFIVIVSSIFICGWGILLVYHINKTFTLRQKSELNKRVSTHHKQSSTFKPIESKSNIEISKLRMFVDDSITNNTHVQNDKSQTKTKSFSVTHNNILHNNIPTNPIPIITDSAYNNNNSIFSLINYDSISSIPSIPSANKHNNNNNIYNNENEGDIITKIINYSIKDVRNENKLHSKHTSSDIHEIAEILNENQTEHSETQSSCSGEIAMDMNVINGKHLSQNTSIQSVMFLYNSDMAIPEGTENEDESTNIKNNNMFSPNTMPTTPKLTESFQLDVSRSPTPTLSDNNMNAPNGLYQSIDNESMTNPWPHTPKLHPSSKISNISSYNTQSYHSHSHSNSTSTCTNMTSITASPIINNNSNTCGAVVNSKINFNELTIEKSCTMETPICSTAKSECKTIIEEEDLDTNDCDSDNNIRILNQWRTHQKNVSDTLVLSEDDNSNDTSSWIDENNNDTNSDGIMDNNNVNVNNSSDSSDSEYHSTTSSISTQIQQNFGEEITENEEESIDFGQ